LKNESAADKIIANLDLLTFSVIPYSVTHHTTAQFMSAIMNLVNMPKTGKKRVMLLFMFTIVYYFFHKMHF